MDNAHNYMMLSRLQSDCEYFLHWGQGNLKALYYGNIEEHISEMKTLWNNFSKKPVWLSMEEIEKYEQDMLVYKN